MLQYLITGLAGMMLGVVALRLWQAREPQAGEAAEASGPAATGDKAASPGNGRKILIAAGALAALGLTILLLRGPGDGAPGNTAERLAASTEQLSDVDTMIARLAARLEQNPDDGEGYRMLGWSYVATGRPQLAIAPYKRAVALLPNQASVHSGYGEALVGVGGGAVNPEAKTSFERALALDRSDPRARHFLALELAQRGQDKQALEQWIALANSAPADAPWQAEVRAKITETAGKLGIDVAARLKSAPASAQGPSAASAGAGLAPPDPAAVAAAERLDPEARQAMVDGMVEGLAAKLRAQPVNPDGWARLIKSRMVLQQRAQAGRDLAGARKALAQDAPGLALVEAAAREAGVPGAR